MYVEALSLPPVSSRAPVSLAPHQPLNPAEERKVLSLVSKHGPDKLYQVTSNISGSKDLDLTLQRGQIVALLQSVDTKGNTSRWLVDAGGTVSTTPPQHPGQKPNTNHFLTLGETAGRCLPGRPVCSALTHLCSASCTRSSGFHMWEHLRLITAGKGEPHTHRNTSSSFLRGFAAGYPLVMDQFKQGCCAMPGNSQVVIPLSSNQSYTCQAAGPHDLCVCVLQVPEGLCLPESSSPFVQNKASSSGCSCQPRRASQREGDVHMHRLKLPRSRWPPLLQLSR